MWHLESGQLTRYRAAVAADGTGADLELRSSPSWKRPALRSTATSSLKSAPLRLTRPDHPRIGLLRHKGLTTWQHL